jgi:hypothetical protein
MKRIVLTLLTLAACADNQPAEQYGFIAQLGRDTVSVESVTRRGKKIVSDEVDRFPRVRQRHTEITLNDDGSIRRLDMDIHTPSESADQRDRHVEADVTNTSVHITKKDQTGTRKMTFDTGGEIAMAHLPQMYSLYELYFAAALKHARATKIASGDPIQMRQFYIDREFDNFPLHRGVVRILPNGKVEIRHDWLSGAGEATIDSSYRLLSYNGDRSTYKVDVTRLDKLPDVKAIGDQFAALEAKTGGVKQLSVRDTTRATIGTATFLVDYSRPLARAANSSAGSFHTTRCGAPAQTQQRNSSRQHRSHSPASAWPRARTHCGPFPARIESISSSINSSDNGGPATIVPATSAEACSQLILSLRQSRSSRFPFVRSMRAEGHW